VLSSAIKTAKLPSEETSKSFGYVPEVSTGVVTNPGLAGSNQLRPAGHTGVGGGVWYSEIWVGDEEGEVVGSGVGFEVGLVVGVGVYIPKGEYDVSM